MIPLLEDIPPWPTTSAKMSFAERKAVALRHPWTLPQLAESDELMRPITRGLPGDTTKPAAQTMGRADLARRRSNYFEEAFFGRGDANSRHERIKSDSIVTVELKTNVIIGDEFIFITELGAKLAERYQRPLSSIAVHVQHSACMFFAGTFEPAYFATISALAPYVQPATNRRNAYLLSDYLGKSLGVPPRRGLIRFVTLPEENIACDGKTLAQALEETGEDGGMGVIDEDRPASFPRQHTKLSAKSLANINNQSPISGDMTPPRSAEGVPPADEKPENVKVAKRRKSFVAGLFGRSASRKEIEKHVPEGSKAID